MSGRPRVRLDTVLQHVARPVAVRVDATYREIGIRSHGKGLFHKAPVLGAALGGKRCFYVEPGDFVLNIVFAWEGAVGLVSEAEQGMIASHRFPTFRSDEERLDVRFLLLFFSTPIGVELLGRVSPGGAGRNRTLNRSAFLALQIPLPPPPEQQRLIARIDELTLRVNEAAPLRQEVEAATEALARGAARAIVDRLAQAFPSAPIGDLVTVRGGGTPSKSDPFYWEGNIPWITPKDMKRRSLADAIDHISERATRETAAKLIDPGAVLVVTRGMILAHTFPSAVLVSPAAINQDMKALVPGAELSAEYLCAVLWSWNAAVLDRVEKSTHDTRKLETTKLLAFAIPVPPLGEQRRIVAELDALQAEMDALKAVQAARRAELDALRPAVLDHAFAGTLQPALASPTP